MAYDVNVSRDGRWWMIEIPAIDGLTQARRVDEVEDMARSLIAVTLDLAPSEIELGSVSINVDGFGSVDSAAAEVSALKAQAAQLEQDASKRQREVAVGLVGAGIPLRDVGAILGVSFQRAGQLVNG